jgi:hypothetical protein
MPGRIRIFIEPDPEDEADEGCEIVVDGPQGRDVMLAAGVGLVDAAQAHVERGSLPALPAHLAEVQPFPEADIPKT